jgi:hypothetical protein
MTHQGAVEEMMVERYLLGELTGDSRDQFEDHMFGCVECAADVKQGVLFLETARQELKAGQRLSTNGSPEVLRRTVTPLSRLWQPRFLAGALAACLALIVYQSAIVFPRLRSEAAIQVAEEKMPTILTPLMLANAGARGDVVLGQVSASRRGVYLLSIDIPPFHGALRYRCSLFSSSGTMLSQVDVSPQQARDAVVIQVPAKDAQEGTNEVRVQALTAPESSSGTLVDLATYRYRLTLTK